MNFDIGDKDSSGKYHPHEFDRHDFEVWLEWDLANGSTDAITHFAAIWFIGNKCRKNYDFVTKSLANSDNAWNFLNGKNNGDSSVVAARLTVNQ